LPHSEIRGSTGALPSPRLFAECHVLHRLSAPRHPPDALPKRLPANQTHPRPEPRPAEAVPVPSADTPRGCIAHPHTACMQDLVERTRPSPAPSRPAEPGAPKAPLSTIAERPGQGPSVPVSDSPFHTAAAASAAASWKPGAKGPSIPSPLVSGRPPRQGLVGLRRVELLTSPLSGVRSNQLSYRPDTFPHHIVQKPGRAGRPRQPATRRPEAGGGERVRTDDLRLAKPALSQLSYTPRSRRRDANPPCARVAARARLPALVPASAGRDTQAAARPPDASTGPRPAMPAGEPDP
jgi:hypothetical protein